MISSFLVSVVLTIIWSISYFLLKNSLHTSKFYFVLLLLMGTAGIILPIDKYVNFYTTEYNVLYIILFAVLLVLTLIPWISFDKAFTTWGKLTIKDSYANTIKSVFVINILLGAYAIIYATPYAIMALEMGADDVRSFITEDTFYPRNIFSTICVGIGYLTPIQILLVFISFLRKDFHKYSFLLVITSLSYLVTMMPYTARDGFIFIPLTYIFLYRVFSNSIDSKLKKSLKKSGAIVGSIVIIGVLFLSIQRFYVNEKMGLKAVDSFIYGTWGYFFQQPYVFEQTLSHNNIFFGFDRRFELINLVFGYNSNRYVTDSLTTSFGTMYADFYDCFGWTSLICLSIFYYLSFTLLINIHIYFKNNFATLLVFVIYLYYTISGLFYYKMYLLSVTELYLSILIFSPLIANIIITKKKIILRRSYTNDKRQRKL